MPALPTKVRSEADETCPVCKQSRYLNPKMTFKINPVCYHRMCDSCIDRIFMAGPAPCPVAGCGKTLRSAGFRKQKFDDLAIERECDIRREVNDVLNKREADFETLRAYNDYLQTKEDLTWNLVYDVDVAATRAQLDDFRRRNRDGIEGNKALERRERAHLDELRDEQHRRQAEAQEDRRRELAEERSAREKDRRAIFDTLMSASGDPEEAVRRARQQQQQQQQRGGGVALKKSSAARSYRNDVAAAAVKKEELLRAQATRQAGEASSLGSATVGGGGGGGSGGSGGLSFAGLKKVEVKGPVGPYDPFGGMKIETKYYKLRDGGDYSHFFDKYRTEKMVVSGGYDVKDYYVRAMQEAHAGLGVILSKEKSETVS